MKKSRKLSLIPKISRANAMEKQSRVRVHDVEEEVGMYLSDPEEKRVRAMIKRKTDKSFALRHPWLTGIPTLGLAPMIAKNRAVSDIVTRLARDNTRFRQRMGKAQHARRKARHEDYKMETKRVKADQPTRAVIAAVPAILAGLQSRRRDEGRRRYR